MITRLDRYLLAELVPPFLFGLLLYSGLAVVSATLPRLQWIVGTPVWELLRWLALQLPTAVVQTLPIALVLAVLLAFGRLATGNELLAMQAGGVPMRRAAVGFVLLGALATSAALALNEWVLPTTHRLVGAEYWQLTAGRSGLFRLVGRNIPVGDFELTFQQLDGDEMRRVRVERWQGDQLQLVTADAGRFQGTDLVLTGYRTAVLDLGALGAPDGPTLRGLVRVNSVAPNPEAELTLTTSITADDLISRYGRGGFEDSRSISALRADANRAGLSYQQRRQAAVLLHRKLAEPFANLTLLLVALPLSILYARTRAVAFGLSLVVTLLWYLLLTFGQLFAQTGALPPWLGPWLGNLVLASLGGTMLLRRVQFR